MSTATLTSLAMLKINIDSGGDYLDYLRPFVLQVLVDQRPEHVTDQIIKDWILRQFGLDIPQKTVQIVLRRLSRSCPLKKEQGVYRITGDLPDPGLAIKKSEAERHINAVTLGLLKFSNTSAKPISSTDNAVVAMSAFLAKFGISCLRAYLRGTAIPDLEGKHDTDIVLVSKYVIHLQQAEPERFKSFLIMVQGHMLANALLCPDLQNVQGNYKTTTFYLDTPLLVQRLGFEGSPKKDAVKELIRLLQQLEGRVATFSHSRKELENVVRGAAGRINSYNSRGAIVMEARRRGTTRSDLLLLVEQIDDKLMEAKIEVKETPRYIKDFQIDETMFEQILSDEVSYYNPHAREYDINSVRSIYVLRKNTQPSSVEKSRAVLVTSNSAFSQAAWNYGQKYEVSREVSSVITDFSLANMAWLKAPMGAPALPRIGLLAFSYAALQPSMGFLNKFLTEIDRLKERGGITERNHQLLRSSALVNDELMNLTLGEETALTEETITETLGRVSNEIKKEEIEKTTAEKAARQRVQDELDAHIIQKEKVQERIYWLCHRGAKIAACVVTTTVIFLLIAGTVFGFGFQSTQPSIRCILTLGSVTLGLLGLVNLLFGPTLKSIHQGMQKRFGTWFFKWMVATIGVDLSESSDD